MRLEGQRLLPAHRERAWDALTDPLVLQSAIPGCESFAPAGPDVYTIVLAAALGPVKARFRGRIALEDVVAHERYRLRFEGEGAAAGFARGEAHVALHDATDGTRLDFEIQAQVGGRIAQVGNRLVEPAARKFVDQFFDAFCARLDERSGCATPAR